jgi:glycosyltransferase involved in cell wall biosynthesis
MAVQIFLILIFICWIVIYFLACRDSQNILQARQVKTVATDFPPVSIIIPARNEEKTLPTCLASLLNLDYPAWEVIVVDDHSTDQTSRIIKSFIPNHPNLKIIQSNDLPSGWTGKNWANYQGMQASTNRWLLFTDADTEFFPHALSSAIAYAQDEGLDMLSLLPRSNMTNFWDRITLPIIGGLIMAWCPFVKVNDPRSAIAGAVGAFILIKRTVYEAVGGHAAIRGKIVDDREFAILVKSSGYKFHLLNGTEIYRVRMYNNLKSLWEGWGKNLFLGMDKSYVNAGGAITIIFFLTVFPFLVLLGCLIGYNWPGGPAVGILSANLAIMWIYLRLQRMFKGNPTAAYGLSLPLGGALVISLIINSIIRYHRGISWSGRNYLKTSVDV